MEAILWKKVVQVVAGDPAWDIGEFFANFSCVLIGDSFERGFDLADAVVAAARYFRAAGQPGAAVPTFFYIALPNAESDSIVRHDFQCFDVVVCFPAHDRVDAAGVIADHAADGAAVMTGGIGSEGQMIFFGGVAEMVEDDSRLHASDA